MVTVYEFLSKIRLAGAKEPFDVDALLTKALIRLNNTRGRTGFRIYASAAASYAAISVKSSVCEV